MAYDAQSLVATAQCLADCIPEGMQLPVLIALCCQIAGVNPNPQTLLANARCIAQNIPPGSQLAVLISIVATNNFGGGQLLIYNADGSTPPPPNPQQNALIYDPAGLLPMLSWNVAAQTWV